MKPNIPLLRNTLEWIEEQTSIPTWDGRSWDQGNWRTVHQAPNLPEAQERKSCHTTYCFAGYVGEVCGVKWVADSAYVEWEPEDGNDPEVVAWSSPDGTDTAWRDFRNPERHTVKVVHVSDRARRLLGISEDQADALFFGGNNRFDLRRMVEEIVAEAGKKL